VNTPVLGMFFAKDPLALKPFAGGQYRVMGRHALGAREMCADSGAAACIWGRLRGARQLRRALERDGVRTEENCSDAALILAGYRLWGEELPAHIEGPASAAVIDRDADRLLLIRDRMGEAPLFYARACGGVAFSDRPLPLLHAPGVSRTVDREGLCEIFALGPARTPGKTPLRDVNELEPGCFLLAKENDVRIGRYFALDAQKHTDDERTTVEKTRFLLEQAVGDTIALQPSCMISGGLDSSAVMALYAKIAGRPPLGFSVDYEDDERYFESTLFRPERDAPWAKLACEAVGARQVCIELSSARLAESLSDAVQARGFPGMADIDSSLLLFARSVSSCSEATLMGECADEAFGGYPWFQRDELIWRDGFPWSGSLPLRESVLRADVREKLRLSRYAAMRYHEACAALPVLPGEEQREARLRMLQGLVFKFFMPNLQERAVRMCMASGVVPLTPFCDERLIEYLYNVPWRLKNLHGETKGLLREAVGELLPDRLLRRKKSPYPKTCHPQYTRLVCAQIEQLAKDDDAPIWAVCDRDAVLTLARGDLSPARMPWYGQLMAGPQMLAYLLQVDMWLRLCGAQIELD